MNRRLLILFPTTHDVIKAERVCLKQGLKVLVVPVPRTVSSECGMALEITPGNRSKITRAITEAGVPVTQIIEVPDVL